MTTTETSPLSRSVTRRAAFPLLVLSGLLLVAFTMRGPFVAVAPAVADIQRDLGIDSPTAGLLTTLPVICFGLATPLVLLLTRRSGLNRAVLIALGVILAGILLRSAGGLGAALAGTVVLGLGITITNVVVPVIIGRDFAGRTTQVTGFYSAALNVGSLAATSLGAPLTGLLSWRWALASWALVVLVAALVWMRAAPSAAPTPTAALPPTPASPIESRPLWRRPLVFGMVLCFAGQSFSYYGMTAWLPSLLADEQGLTAAQAGNSSSFFQGLALVSAIGLPLVMRRGLSGRAALMLVCVCWVSMPLGLAVAPGLWVVWSCLGGFAQGGGFTVIFSMVVDRAQDHDDARRISAAVQGVGYTLGALGPIIVGAVHSATGSWTAPMLVIVAMIGVMAVGGATAMRPARVGTSGGR